MLPKFMQSVLLDIEKIPLGQRSQESRDFADALRHLEATEGDDLAAICLFGSGTGETGHKFPGCGLIVDDTGKTLNVVPHPGYEKGQQFNLKPHPDGGKRRMNIDVGVYTIVPHPTGTATKTKCPKCGHKF